jgi:hypothetical protein
VFDQFKRLVFLPILVSNLYSMHGVLFLNWSVADIYFWFWCELILAGITSFVFLLAWRPFEKKLSKDMLTMMPYLFGFSFLFILFYATLFTALAYRGEWHDYDRLPEFLADKRIGLLAMVLSYAVFLIYTLSKPDRGSSDSTRLSKPFNRKCVVVLGLYMLFLIHGWIREWTTGARLNITPEYLKGMGIVLLMLKFLVELVLLDPPFKRQTKIEKPPFRDAQGGFEQ